MSETDLISRQEAIDELMAMREHIDSEMSVIGCTAYEMAIEALREPERATGKWIPCSERLPEESGRYLISAFDGIARRTTVVQYQTRCKAWTMTGRMAYWNVIAWMPLPEPYKEEQG